MRPISLSLLFTATVAVAAARATAQQTTPQKPQPQQGPLQNPAATSMEEAVRANPFAAPSPLPYQAPPFDRIKNANFGPAIEAGMLQQLGEVTRITADQSAPTFANTIEALEKTGALLTRASKVFFAMTQANTDPELQQLQQQLAPRLAAHKDAIYLDQKLFARVDAVFAAREQAGLDAEQLWLVERIHRDFVRAGAKLSAEQQQQLREMNKALSSATTEFQKLLLAARNEGAVAVADPAQLAGLDEPALAAAAAAAKERGVAGHLLALQNTTQQPVLASLRDRDLRARVLAASMARGSSGGQNDSRRLLLRIAALRAEKAKLLGYQDWAAYALDDQMAGTPQKAISLLTDLVPAATQKARGEIARMQQEIDRDGGGFRLTAADWQFYAERVRKAEYDLDEAAIRPYFELDRVLRDGVFFMAHELYGLSFAQRTDLPVYHPDVRVFEVSDQDGKPFALWYCDYFERGNKSGGAWMDSFVDQSLLLGTKPVVFNVCNFTAPAPGQPALLNFDDVTTMFHEFGHALHGVLSNVRYPTQSGTNVPRDFVEFPSQFHEHFATEPHVLAHYARHHATGAPMPAELVERLLRAKTFNQGYATTEYLAAALLDMAWHSLPAGQAPQDALAFEQQALQRYHVDLAEVPPRYRSTYFAHIFSGEYAAGYYAYLWSEVLDDDAWEWFVEHGGMTRANGQRFRDMVLSRGGTMDAAAMFRAFRGRDPSVEPLLRERGLQPAAPVGR